MAVQVTLTFNSYDEAIVALGKLVGAPAKATSPVRVPEAETPGAVAAAPATRTRKPRSDAGQPRGAYKARNEPAAPQQGEPANAVTPAVLAAGPAPAAEAAAPEPARNSETANAEAPSEPSAPATQAANPPAASAPSEKDAQAALEGLFNARAKAGGNGAAIQAAKDLLSRYGVQKVRDLPAERRAEFIKECEAGGTV
jgi:hypothetical protein